MLRIKNHQTGEVEKLVRDVRHKHSDWVHAQLGTESEAELQLFLDNCILAEFAANPDREDTAGVFMSSEDAADYYAND